MGLSLTANRLLLLASLLVMVSLPNHAQTKLLTGTVAEMVGKNKEPVLGANVVVVNSQNRYIKGTVTNLNGEYAIEVPQGQKNIKIRFSYIGLATQTINYTGQGVCNVVLTSQDRTTLKEVNVTGTRRDKDLLGVGKLEQTASTQKLVMSEIVDHTPVASIEEALQGQIAGMDITLGGDPGAKSSIRIRGTSSLNSGDEPLIVIDGVPYDIEISDDFSFQTANEEDFGQLLNISPADIESIEVLKDASATAIYGTKGANGVILVNKKRGSYGKTKFAFSSKLTAKKEPDAIPLLNGKQYVSLMEDAIWNAANSKGLSNSSALLDLLYNTDEINFNPDFKYFNEYNCDTDWLSLIRQNAVITDNNLSMTGGGEKATYRLGLGYYNEQGTTRGTALNRLSTSMKITYNFSDRLRVSTDFSFTNTSKDANVLSNARSVAQKRMPNVSPYYIDSETLQPTSQYFQRESDFQGSYSSIYNPLALVNDGFNKTNIREEKMTVTLNYDFPFHLRYQGYVSVNMRTTKNKQFLPQTATGVLWTSSNANLSTDATSDAFTLQTENKLIYNNTLRSLHTIIATALVRTSQSQSFSSSSKTSGNASVHLTDPIVGSVVAGAGSGDSETRSVSFIGQAVYTFDNRYVARATINYEGNSAMGSKNRFAPFPAFGLAWNADQEHWISDKVKEVLTEAKLRLGLGWAGKAPKGAAYYLGAYQSLGTYMNMSALTPVRMQLDKLKWESTREYDLGIDLKLFKKLGITFDYYDKYTSDLLLTNTSVPATTGYTTIKYFNSGEMSNKGFELRFDYEIYRNKGWTITANANCSRNINKVEKLPDTWSYDSYSFGNGNYAIRIVEGSPIGSFYGYRYLGVYDNVAETYARNDKGEVMYDYKGNVITMRNGTEKVYPGDAKYEDVNHDGVINQNDIVYLGNSNPKLIFGGGVTVRYKDLSLNAFFYGRLGQKVINKARMNLEGMRGTDNQSTAVLNRWRTEGDAAKTDIPRALYGMGYNYLGSDRFVEDATYVRLKTLTLSYNLPKRWMKSLGITNANFFVTGYDLFTWTNYSGQDPEVSLPSAYSPSTDNSTTPVTKRVSFGLNLNF